ncbi:MAG: ShlB/FhaC/HecB family hemolysin secretion/activation protein [Betaproteobacteria bacterium]
MTRYLNNNTAGRLGALLLIALCGAPASAWSQTPPAASAPILEVKHFIVEGENPLSPQETQAILAPHLGAHKSLATIEAAASALEQALRSRGHSFHRVIVPAQRPTGGELRLQVLHFPLNEVTVTGNQHFSAENILRSLPGLEAGKSPDLRALSSQLGLANEHPSKRLTINIKESAKRDALDAEVRVRDGKIIQPFVSLTGHTRDFDNTINENTGYTRLTLGLQHANLFDLDHVATLAYTTSPENVSNVTQYGLFYWLPFYGYNTSLNAYYTKSDVNTGTVGLGGQSFDVSGKGEFWGIRATYALPRIGEISQHVSLAIDDRYFESTLATTGLVQTVPVGSRPISLRYTARQEKPGSTLGGYLEYAVNTGGGRASSDSEYAVSSLRTGQNPGPNWEAWRWGLEAHYGIATNWLLVGRFRGQYADEPLIPGEQFGIGGAASVRGLRERETSGDRGYFFNIELQAPDIGAGVLPFVFYDQGYRRHVSPVPGLPVKDSASSIGAGLRWNWQRKLDVSVTYANVLNGVAAGTPGGHDKLLFSAFYRF